MDVKCTPRCWYTSLHHISKTTAFFLPNRRFYINFFLLQESPCKSRSQCSVLFSFLILPTFGSSTAPPTPPPRLFLLQRERRALLYTRASAACVDLLNPSQRLVCRADTAGRLLLLLLIWTWMQVTHRLRTEVSVGGGLSPPESPLDAACAPDFVTGARKNRDMFDTSRTSLAPLITLFWLMLQREKINCSVPLFKGFRSLFFFHTKMYLFSFNSHPPPQTDRPITNYWHLRGCLGVESLSATSGSHCQPSGRKDEPISVD